MPVESAPPTTYHMMGSVAIKEMFVRLKPTRPLIATKVMLLVRKMP